MISIVIPVYRSAHSLTELHSRLESVMRDYSRRFEVIFVEDCGGDNSWAIITELARTYDDVRGFRLSRNYGQHNALLCGIREARGSIVVTLDDDLQHPPEVLPKLISKLEDGHDVVYGTPDREQHGVLRDLASRITKFGLQSIMGAENASNVSALRVFRTDLRHAFSNYHSPTVNIDVLLTWGTSNFAAIVVPHQPRKTGESGYTFAKLIGHALNMITGFSTLPLKLASLTGLGFSLLGLFVLTYVLINWLIRGSAVPGFTFLASTIAVFSGVQLLALGIIGEYLARVYARSMNQPGYFVRETISTEGAKALES